MTEPSKAQSAATHSAVPRPHKRGRRLLLVLVTALSGVSLSGVSLAASSQPLQQKHETVSQRPRHAPSSRPPAQKAASNRSAHAGPRPAARATTPKSKRPEAQRPTHRKAPANARIAAKSKAPKRPHQSPSRQAKPATKQAKPVA